MGARLWSQRRTARASPQPCHAQTIISPAAFTHSDKLPAATTTDLGRVTSVRRYPTTIRPSSPNDSCPPNNSLPPNDSSSLPPELSLWPMEYRKDGQPVPPHSSAAKKKKKKAKEGRDPFSSPEHLHHQQQHLHQQQQLHHHQSFHHPAPASVLMIGMEAASTRDPTALQRSMKPDPTLNLPYQVPRLDGEERHPPKKYHMGPEHDETTREFIRAPANKTVTDVGNEATHRPTHLAMYSTPGECGPYSHLHHPPSSSSSSSSQPGYGDEGRSSPRRSRQMSENLVSQVQPHYRAQFSPNKSYQESSRRGGWHEEGLGMSTPSPSHDPTLSYSTTSSTLADITSMPVGCGPTGLSSGDRHTGVLRDSQAMSVGSLGVQSVSHRYEQLSESSCSPSAEHDYPPFRSDVIDDSILDTSVSRPSEQRTKSGKI